ncbi:hypothetical protein K2173_018258 [Erythroxylum novogranatense]|uniref:DUF6737 domain-containing protein n=1 Tax=Erythroxylum novogranatense TaxID=1862640 RepID=A0AAV8U9X8_9ROSI|nr:hypothetical protein K2173_018258 [Erythroxylum novogranatense]
MGTLSILPLSCPPPSAFPSSSCARTDLSKSISSPRLTFENLHPINLRTKTVVFGAGSRGPDEYSQFLDENGEVEDMDGYLNYLSLEYESVWDTKPSWCQPWTITLTGLLAIVCSWLTLQSAVVTSMVTVLICSWWYIFLYSYPKVHVAHYVQCQFFLDHYSPNFLFSYSSLLLHSVFDPYKHLEDSF